MVHSSVIDTWPPSCPAQRDIQDPQTPFVLWNNVWLEAGCLHAMNLALWVTSVKCQSLETLIEVWLPLLSESLHSPHAHVVVSECHNFLCSVSYYKQTDYLLFLLFFSPGYFQNQTHTVGQLSLRCIAIKTETVSSNLKIESFCMFLHLIDHSQHCVWLESALSLSSQEYVD